MNNFEKIHLIAIFIEFIIGCIIAPIVFVWALNNKDKKGD